MNFKTTLDAETFYQSLYIQNDIFSKRLMFSIRATLIMAVLALTIKVDFVGGQTDWFIRALICAVAVAVHAIVSKKSRAKMLRQTAENIYNSNGGALEMNYRIEDDAFYGTGPDGEEHENSYRAIKYLAETDETFVIVMSKEFMHAIRKADLTAEECRQLSVKFYTKSGIEWKAYKNIG